MQENNNLNNIIRSEETFTKELKGHALHYRTNQNIHNFKI